MINCWNRRIGRQGQLCPISACYKLPGLLRECWARRSVLVFSADIGNQTALGCPAGKASDVVHSLCKRPAKVIENRLAEMVPVG
jgi:hypothetical protein